VQHAIFDCTLTILTLCPGVAVMSQVHSLRLGYLSGQFGLLRVPLGLWILCSHSAGHTHTEKQKSTHIGRKLISWLYRKRPEEMEREQEGEKQEDQRREKGFQRNTSWSQVQCKFHMHTCTAQLLLQYSI